MSTQKQILNLATNAIASLTVCAPFDVGYVETAQGTKGNTIYSAFFEGNENPAVVAEYKGDDLPGSENSTILAAEIYCDCDALEGSDMQVVMACNSYGKGLAAIFSCYN